VRFPYAPREGQKELMGWIADTLANGGHLVVEAGTGTGKTVSALFPSLEYALENGKKVLYLTRTNSQQDQVMRELAAIKKTNGSAFYGVALQGRGNMCPLAMSEEELRYGAAEELAKLCASRKKKVRNGDEEACPYYAKTLKFDAEKLRIWVADKSPNAGEFIRYCLENGICPYEANRILMPGAILVSAPYIYFFEPGIRRALLTWMGVSTDDLIVIVDEAHNLPEYARELVSAELSLRSLANAQGEAERFGNPEVLDGVAVSDAISVMREAILSMAEEYIPDGGEDSFVPEKALEEHVMIKLGINSRKIELMAMNLMNFGDIIKDRKKEEGKLPRSYIHTLGDFISFWINLESNEYIKLVKGGENARIEAYCMDASVATEILNLTHSSIHMSGTLSPLEEYRDTTGLSFDTELKKAKSPFPSENRLVLYSSAATTRYEDVKKNPANISVLEELSLKAVSVENRNSAVFFPSFSLMDRFMADGWHMRLRKGAFLEEKGMSGKDLMRRIKRFRTEKGAVLMAVVGGRVSEGIDFPAEALEIAVIVGIPYPKPTAKQRAMERFYDMRFGKGWEYTVKAPTTRKILQTIGRLIRTETDRGVAVILDRRAVHFSDTIEMHESTDIPGDIRAFFRRV